MVLNRAAEVEEQERQAAAAAAEQEAAAAADAEMQDAEQQTEEAAEAEVEQEQQAAQEAAPAWQPRVIVLGRLHKAVSTAERVGEVVVVRPTHLAAQRAQPAAAPEVVVVPPSARKTPAPSAAKHARTPAPSAAKGRTPATALAKTPATAAATAAKSAAKAATAAKSSRKSIGGLGELPKSMVKEAPGETPAGGVRAFLAMGWQEAVATSAACARFRPCPAKRSSNVKRLQPNASLPLMPPLCRHGGWQGGAGECGAAWLAVPGRAAGARG